jgi:hypothetical protein
MGSSWNKHPNATDRNAPINDRARVSHAMQTTYWQLDGHTAKLTLPRLSLAFNANQPGDGLKNIRVLDRYWNGRLFGVTGPIQTAAKCELADWHIRGDDLVACYETGQPDAARIDLLWHVAKSAEGDPQIARIDLLVSIRTDRLDWRHDVRLESVVPAAEECWEYSQNSSFFAGNDWDWSLGLMVHSSDLRRRELKTALGLPGARLLQHELFSTEMLEKGVILRARAAALFLHAGAEAQAFIKYTRAYLDDRMHDFLAADPPLGV